MANRHVAGQRARARRTLDRGATARRTADEQRPTATALLDRSTSGKQRPSGGRLHRPVSPPRTALVVVLVCLTVALAATAGGFAFRARQAAKVEDARTAALAAAQVHAEDILSYDYRTLDKDFARARKAITGGFARDYEATTTRVVRPPAVQYKAVVKAEVAAASVVRAEPSAATVLLFVNQTTTSTRLDGPKVDLNRVRLTLVREGGAWLVSDVDAL